MGAERGKSSIAWKVQVLIKTKLEEEERSRNERLHKWREVSRKTKFPKALDSSHFVSRSGNRLSSS